MIAVFAAGALWSGSAMVDIDQIRIARFRHDHDAAVSYTYDDGYPDHVSLAAPMLDKYGFKGTFFLIVGNVLENDAAVEAAEEPANSWDDWRRIAGNGHEIGNHSWSHANLAQADADKIEYEVNHAYDIIAQEIEAPISFCFPYNMSSSAARAVVRQRHLFSRSYQKTYGGSSFTAGKANDYVDEAIANGDWMVAMIHAILDGWQPFSSEQVLDDHFAYVSTLDNIWVATFGQAGLYKREREAAALSGAAVNGDVVTFTPETSLDPQRVSTSVTVVLPCQDVDVASAVQAGASVPVVVKGDKIMIDCTPGAGAVTLTLGLESAIAAPGSSAAYRIAAPRAANQPRFAPGVSISETGARAFDIRGRIVPLDNIDARASSVLLPINRVNR
jgi:peptidoglycan/xylan/chitin deacetylase (PgdA/CDA1 family)